MRRRIGALVAAVVATAAVLLGPATGARAATTHTPVVFVHGYTGSPSNWTTAIAVFEAAGYSSDELYAFSYDSYGDNRTNARSLASYVNQVKAATGSAKVDIVNHSMGGLVSDWYLHELGGAASVAHLASIAGANHGTTAAYACTVYVTCRQMVPGSSFIRQVTSGDETPGDTTYATWYSPCDGVINPYTSTMLSGATNHLVACQTHIGYLTDTTTLGQVRQFLST